MRHRAGSCELGRTAGGPAGVNTPRPGRRVHGWIVAGIVAAHGVFVAIAWQPAAALKAATPQRMSMRLLASVSRPAAGIVSTTEAQKPALMAAAAPAPKPRAARPEPRSKAAEPAAPLNVAVAVAVVAPVPIQGVAFAPPSISFGPPPVRREAAPPMPPLQAQMQGQFHAARAQVADALQRELGAWQPPLASQQGACALAAEPESHLACDNDALSTAIAPRETALVGFLRAWRSMDPRTQGLTIAVVDGRYQASWN